MTQTKLITTLSAAAALAAAALPAAASAKPVHACSAKHGVTAKSTSKVRVYSTRGSDFGSVYYACWRNTGRSHRLAENTGGAHTYDAFVRHIQVKGKYVGFTDDARGDKNYDEFVVVDAASGKRIHDVKTPKDRKDPEGTFTLTASGQVA